MKVREYVSGIRRRLITVMLEDYPYNISVEILEDGNNVNYESFEKNNYIIFQIEPYKIFSKISLIIKDNDKIILEKIINNSIIKAIKNKLNKKNIILMDEDNNNYVNIINSEKNEVIFETNHKNFDVFVTNKKGEIKCKLDNITDDIYKCYFENDIYPIRLIIVKNNIVLSSTRLSKSFNRVGLFKTKYYPFTGVGVSCFALKNFSNPEMTLLGTFKDENTKLILKADGKEIKYNNKAKSIKDFDVVLDVCSYKHLAIYAQINSVNIKFIETYCSKFKVLLITIKVKFLNRLMRIMKLLGKGIKSVWKKYHFLIPPKLWGKYLKKFIRIIRNPYANPLFYELNNIEDYHKWIEDNEKFVLINEKELAYKPLISFIVPVYNVSRKLLTECINSMLNQTYTNFEICLADDNSTNRETIETLKEYENKSDKIKVVYRKKNGHISACSNSALELAKGEFVALVDNDDIISKHALMEFVKVLNKDKKLDFIYSDEDKLDSKNGRCYPHFKPDFSPDTLLSLNYICHLSLIRKSIMDKIGGFEVGLEGAQDHDIFLKISEITDRIYHIPMILYHWRMILSSTSTGVGVKDYASDKGKIAVENALKRRKISANVEKEPISGYYIVNYNLKKQPKVSIIIPTKDYADTLDVCLKSIYKKTTYTNFEVIVVNNNSEKKETFKLFDIYKKKYENFKVVDANIEFNYSRINNLAVKEAKGEYILLLNNDTELITSDWLEKMVGYASQKHIGAVGVKLLYPDSTIQHAGVILGLGGVAGHAFVNYENDNVKNTMFFGRLYVPYNYSAVTAACLMIKKSIFEEVGGLTEDLKVAFNDIDFCIKVLQKGYKNIFLPNVELFHYESKSRGLDTTEEKLKRFQKECKYMHDHWHDIISNDSMYNPNMSYMYAFRLDKEINKKEY